MIIFQAEFASAYAHLLCNIAEGYEILGEAPKSAEKLSLALKALNGHENDMRTALTTARILRLIACVNMQGAQAVTAEGLFRSAEEKLVSPFAKNDPRQLFESSLVTGYYGQLLCKWDKREAKGKESLEEATKLLQQWQSSLKYPRAPLTSVIYLPFH